MVPLSVADALASVRACETALRAGHHGLGVKAGPNVKGAVKVAAEALGISHMTLFSRVKPGGSCETLHGLSVDWTLGGDTAPADPIAVRTLSDRLRRTEAGRAEAERRAAAGENLRASLFRLAAEPLEPPSWRPAKKGRAEKLGEAIVLPVSDVHMGELIDRDQMGGRNSYNQRIAHARLQRLFETAIKLATVHWSGPPPGVIYVPLLGDLVSGEIHDELAKSNDLLSVPAVRAVAEGLIAGLARLVEAFPKVPIHVVSVPGNHGRTTRKPEAKGFALNSYDTLVAWLIEAYFRARGEKRVTFSAPASGDALVNIHGWNILFTHGDRIGSRGGAGYVGVAATATRGMKRLIEDYAAEGQIVDKIVIGHFHTPLELEYGFVSGTLAGPSEYSRSGRFKSHPASQWMLTVHPDRGIARRWQIQVGDPSEGSIYKGRAA